MHETEILDYDAAERALAEDGEIFWDLEAQIIEVKYNGTAPYWYNRYGHCTLEDYLQRETDKYLGFSRKALREFNQMPKKPKKIVFPNVFPDGSLDAAYVGYHGFNGLCAGIIIAIKEFETQGNKRFKAIGGNAKTMIFGYRLD